VVLLHLLLWIIIQSIIGDASPMPSETSDWSVPIDVNDFVVYNYCRLQYNVLFILLTKTLFLGKYPSAFIVIAFCCIHA
jgi:hypothetical protein